MKKILMLVLFLFAVVLICVPMTLRATLGQNAKPPILIGVPLPLTGNLAKSGNDLLAGIDYAAQHINQTGGVDGREVKLVTRDTRGDPAEAAHAVVSLITQDNVAALVGSYGSTPSMAGLKAAAKYNKIFVHSSDGALSLAEEFGPTKWYFHVYLWDPYRGYALASLLNGLKPKPHTVAIAHESGLYGSTAADQVVEALKKAGYDVVANVPFTTGSADYTPVIQQIKGTNPDIFFWVGYATDNGLIAKQAQQQRLGAKLLVDVSSAERIEVYGKQAAQGVASIGLWWPTIRVKGLDQWVNGIKAAEKLPDVSQTNAQGYSAMITLMDAMRAAHGTDQDKVIEHLEKDTYWTPFGSLRYREYTIGNTRVLHQLTLPENQTVIQYRGDDGIVVWPPAVATGKITYPVDYTKNQTQ